jgi:hypothetical protein
MQSIQCSEEKKWGVMMMPMMTKCLLLLTVGIAAMAAPSDGMRPSPPPKPSNDGTTPHTIVMISVTATPLKAANADRVEANHLLEGVHEMLASLHVEYILRHHDGQVVEAIFSSELGEVNGEPHIQRPRTSLM